MSEPIKIGTSYLFDYPPDFVTLPDYTVHAGQVVTVCRELGPDESDHHVDPENCEPMYEVQAADGWRGHAFDSELKDQ